MKKKEEKKETAALFPEVEIQKEFHVKRGLPLLRKERAFTTNLQFFPCPELAAKETAHDITGREVFRNLIWTYDMGKLNVMITGEPHIGLPYGVVSRLIINWIDNEIIYNTDMKKYESMSDTLDEIKGGYKIKWSESISEFCTKSLGIQKKGDVVHEIQNQFEKISNMNFRVTFKNGEYLEERKIPFVVDQYFRWKKNSEKKEFEENTSWILIHPLYVKYIVERKFFVDPKIIKAFLRNPEGIDLYKYFKYISRTQKSNTEIPLSEIRKKLGWKGESDNLKRKVKGIIEKIMENDSSIKLEIRSGINRWTEVMVIIHQTATTKEVYDN